MPQKKTEKFNGVTSRVGCAYVTSTGRTFSNVNVDAETLRKMLVDSIYINGLINQTINLVLAGGKPKITVYDEEDNPVEDVSRKLNIMFSKQDCDIASMARKSLSDILIWGISIYNHVWDKNEEDRTELICYRLENIDSYAFRTAPSNSTNGNAYGHILKGIVYSPTDDLIHYFKTNSNNGGQVSEIPNKDLFIIKDSASAYPDGNSIMCCTIPIALFQEYCWDALGQQMFRTGAPIMFIKVINPQPARRSANGEEIMSDIEYAEQIMANWGKDTPFALRENMEISTIDVKEGSLAIQAINKAKETIQDYMSPIGMLGRDGTLISGNSDAALKLVNNYIQGWVSLLEQNLRRLPNYYLKHNAYPEGWHAEVKIPSTTVEDTTGKLNIAQLLYNSKTGTVNEVRELCGLEPVGVEELRQMKEEWDIIGVQQPMQFAMSNYTPNKPSYKKRNEIAGRAVTDIDDLTEDLMRSALRVTKAANKASKEQGI